MGELLPLLIQGAWVTLQVTIFGSLLAIVAAILAALGRMSPWRPLRWFSIAYIEVFRGTSLLVQLFWLFFVLPLPPFNLELSPYSVAIVGLGLHIGAYGAEVMRGAISSVAKGQYEASTALNFSGYKRFRRIILPLAGIAGRYSAGYQPADRIAEKYFTGVVNHPVRPELQGSSIGSGNFRDSGNF
jgi:polar amino acid transport system permease protein